MDSNYALEIANTINSQLMGTVGLSVMYSWGTHAKKATYYKDMPGLLFSVKGRLFTGKIIVSLNSSDYYEIYLINKTDNKCISSECTWEEMGDIIDKAIEKGDDPQEYNKFLSNTLKKAFT